MALLSRYLNSSLITAVAIVIASFLGTILGNITFLRINLKKKNNPILLRETMRLIPSQTRY